MTNKPSLQIALQNAIPELTNDHFAYHATDLYVVALTGVHEFLLNYRLDGKQRLNFKSFYSQPGSNWAGAGKLCYDVSFMGKWTEL